MCSVGEGLTGRLGSADMVFSIQVWRLALTRLSFPGSAWERNAREAPASLGRKLGGASRAVRSQAEPGNESFGGCCPHNLRILTKKIQQPSPGPPPDNRHGNHGNLTKPGDVPRR